MHRRAFLENLGLGAVGVAALGATAGAEGFAAPPERRTDPTTLRRRWREALAGARSRHIARLSIYRDVGRFPHNHRVLGKIPTFIDDRGVPCAVGHLMRESGYGALAADIARTSNNIYIEEITDGPAMDWILRSGLTREECSLIQPSYHWRDPPIERPIRPMPPAEPPDPEQETLRQHFVSVERQLRAQTDMSLRVAMARLEPHLAAPVDAAG